MWPNARISVMGGEQAAGVLAQVRRDNLEARGQDVDRRGGGGVQGADPRAVRDAGPSLLRHARGCGTTASSIRPTPAGCSGSGSPPRCNAPMQKTALRRVPDVRRRMTRIARDYGRCGRGVATVTLDRPRGPQRLRRGADRRADARRSMRLDADPSVARRRAARATARASRAGADLDWMQRMAGYSREQKTRRRARRWPS